MGPVSVCLDHTRFLVSFVVSKVDKGLLFRHWRSRGREGEREVTGGLLRWAMRSMQMQCESTRQDTNESWAQKTRQATTQPHRQVECRLCQMKSRLKAVCSQSQKSRLEAGRAQSQSQSKWAVAMGSSPGQRGNATRYDARRSGVLTFHLFLTTFLSSSSFFSLDRQLNRSR